MSGIGIEFRRIYKRRNVTATLHELGHSMITTITPMLLTMLVLFALYATTDYDSARYADRELLSLGMTYIFVFSLLVTALFSGPVSHCLSDLLFVSAFDDVMPTYAAGLALTMGTAGVLGVAFAAVLVVGGSVSALFAFLQLFGFLSMSLAFYNMTFVSAAKGTKRIAIYFLAGMGAAFCLAQLLELVGVETLCAIFVGMDVGFLLIAALEYAYLRAAFPGNSGNHTLLKRYLKRDNWVLISSFLYTLGLFCHNFVYWFSSLGVTVAQVFRYAPTYDKAAFIGMYTNVMAGVLFVMQVDSHFADRYRAYAATVNVGRLQEIRVAQNRMFRMISHILFSTVKLQFICAVGLYLLFMVVLPGLGFYGLTMDFYPCLAAGYFAMYVMYGQLMFQHYLDDRRGALATSLVFLLTTCLGSAAACLWLPYDWQGIGLFAGSVCGWTVSYFRLGWLEKHYEAFVFCQGQLVKRKSADMPDGCAYRAQRS